MGLLSALARGLVRGADRAAEFTSKRGPRSHNKGRGAKRAGFLGAGRAFLGVREMVPELVVPALGGCRLRPYVSYKAPPGSAPPLTARRLFLQAVAPRLAKDVREGTFEPRNLGKYGFEPAQDGKLFRLFPKNYVR